MVDFPWVRAAMWATIPSGAPAAVRNRSRLLEAMAGKPFVPSTDNVVSPRLMHSADLDDYVRDLYSYVGFAKMTQHTSPYSCPYHGEHYSADAARSCLDSRADIADLLGRLSGRTLVCNCSMAGVFPEVRILNSKGSGPILGPKRIRFNAPSSATRCSYDEAVSTRLVPDRALRGRALPSTHSLLCWW